MSSIKPDDGGSQIDGGEKIASGFIIAGGDSAELFEFCEEIFNQMPCFIEFLIVGALDFAVGFGWNDPRFSGLEQGLDHSFIGIVTLVGQEGIGLEARQPVIRSLQITGLTRREGERGGMAQGIDKGVNLGAQTALTPPHRFVATVFFCAPALCG